MRDNDLESAILESGSLMRRGYTALLKNCGKLIAALTALTVVLVTFTEIGFYEIGARELTANLILVLVASYVIYFSLEDAGEALGRESEEYKAAEKELRSLINEVDGGSIGELRAYVSGFVSDELKQRREAYLLSEGIDPEPSGKDTRSVRRKRRQASRMKPIRLNAATLLALRGKGRRELKNPEWTKLPSLLLKLLPSTVCTVFTASVMLSVKDGLGVTQIIEGMVRLCPLPIVALKGYTQGYVYSTEDEIEWIRAKSRILSSFLKSHSKCNV